MPSDRILLVFDASNRLLCRKVEGRLDCTCIATAAEAGVADASLSPIPDACPPVQVGELPANDCDAMDSHSLRILFSNLPGHVETPGLEPHSIEELSRLCRDTPDSISPLLRRLLPFIREHSIRIPYLAYSENQYIYRFRTDRERNREIYRSDERSQALYQSRLCEAIKAAKRVRERTASSPALLDFGPVRYLVPSHFGFCLGVQNAIERAYETISANPGRRVFMLSELIHNPFVNNDLVDRGLQYLQNDKGRHLINPATGVSWWDELTPDDIVIIPAFGATDADKRRLIEKGLPLNQYDATCMLVEKVWKAARRHGQDGYTVIIHGKAEHEETKATFSNSSKYAPSLIVRDMKEMRHLGNVILEADPLARAKLFWEAFEGRTSHGFDPNRDLDRIAVVNQTTLLRNETISLIDHLESVFAQRYGADKVREHLSPASRGDTLCYATQVNQDALEAAIKDPDVDFALVIGGRNSSNTYQLYRMCAVRYAERSFYIQSEHNIPDAAKIQHYIFASNPADPKQGRHESRTFLPEDFTERAKPWTFLITGGASCPDGIIQQVITRINSFFPPDSLRSIDDVIRSLEQPYQPASA